MATTNYSVPILVSQKFAGGASTDINQRIATARTSITNEVDSKLAAKVDRTEFDALAERVAA